MRALHLLSLRGPGGKKLRYYPTEIAPLIIPWWFSVSDREIILAFYQQILEEQPLPRVEVDWYRSLVPADRAFLQHIAEKRRATEHLVVVKVRHESADLRDVLTHPDLQPFRYVAITCDHSLPNETFGRISELTAFVSQVAEALYEELAAEFSLRDDGPELLEPLVRSLLNPIPVVEAYNALIDVQAERIDPAKQLDAVYLRILRRLVENMPTDDVVALAAFALRGRTGFDEVVAEEEQTRRRTALETRLVLRDERLVRWAKWLEQSEFVEVISGALKVIIEPPQIPPGANMVYQWIAPIVEPAPRDNWTARINTLFRWLNEGQVGRVREELRVLEKELDLPTTTDLMRADYWHALGRYCDSEGRFEESVAALRNSLDLIEAGQASARVRAGVIYNLAYSLREGGRWNEAEPLFRELVSTSNLSRRIRGLAMDHLARGLRDHARWADAEPLFREAIRLKEEGNGDDWSRGITHWEYAQGLRLNGQIEEAESQIKRARQLFTVDSGNAVLHRVYWLREYARRLRRQNRSDEADEIEALAERIRQA